MPERAAPSGFDWGGGEGEGSCVEPKVERAIEVTKKDFEALEARWGELGFGTMDQAPKVAPEVSAAPGTRPRTGPSGRGTPRIDYKAKARELGFVTTFKSFEMPSDSDGRAAFLEKSFSPDQMEREAGQKEKRAAQVDSVIDQAEANTLRSRAKLIRAEQEQPGLPTRTDYPDWARPMVRAARFGDPEAQLAMGALSEGGRFGHHYTKADVLRREALTWFEAADRNGNKNAGAYLERLRKRLGIVEEKAVEGKFKKKG